MFHKTQKNMQKMHYLNMSMFIYCNRQSSWESFYKNFTEKKHYFRGNFFISKVRKYLSKGKRRHQHFSSELSGCKKIINLVIRQKKLLKKLDFMKMWFWEKLSHIALYS